MDPRNPTPVPLEEYLRTHYRPDRDWMEGKTLERNWCETPHSRTQAALTYLLAKREDEWGIEVLPSIRMQISEERYRVCDVCAVRVLDHCRDIVRTPPLLCIEILAREDGMSAMMEKIEDYLGMGAVTVWMIDPDRRKAYSADANGAILPVAETLHVPGTAIEISVAAIFAELDSSPESEVRG